MRDLQQEALRRRQAHCPHHRLVTTMTQLLVCQQCQLDHTGILLVALNDRLQATIAALAQVGLQPCVTCQQLLPTGALLALPVDPSEAAHEERLHQLYCAGDAVTRIERDELDVTDDQLRWFGEHLRLMPSWLREAMTARVGYRSLDLDGGAR